MNLLVVEDDAEMAELLVRGLREEAHDVDLAHDGHAALALANASSFDVILLDVMLPGMDGLSVAKELRLRREQVPVLMLTACDALPDLVKGLDAGADDYMTKPFSFVELLARLRALGRRRDARPKNVLEVEDVILDATTHRTFRAGREIQLSHTEFRLLELLVRNRGSIVSRSAIAETLWGSRREIEDNTIDAFIRLLRKKLDSGSHSKLINTHRGFGYSVGALN